MVLLLLFLLLVLLPSTIYACFGGLGGLGGCGLGCGGPFGGLGGCGGGFGGIGGGIWPPALGGWGAAPFGGYPAAMAYAPMLDYSNNFAAYAASPALCCAPITGFAGSSFGKRRKRTLPSFALSASPGFTTTRPTSRTGAVLHHFVVTTTTTKPESSWQFADVPSSWSEKGGEENSLGKDVVGDWD